MSESDFKDPNAPKVPLVPLFFTDKVHMTFKSEQEGHPIYEMREFVRVFIPGNRGSVAVEPVGPEQIARWPKEYAAFKENREAPLEGTPLGDWPNSQMTAAKAEELAYFHIKTVEQLAAVNDLQLQNLGMGARQLRESAIKFLDVAKNGTAPLERLVTENLRLRDEVERLKADKAQLAVDLDRALGTRETINARA
jgi:hypothetical protein